MKKKCLILFVLIVIAIPIIALCQNDLLTRLEKAGIWKVDRINNRCLVDPGVWRLMTFEEKEKTLWIIYIEEKTWWELYDRMSGKLIGKVGSLGLKIYP